MMGLLVPLLGVGLLLGAMGGMYQCVYTQGKEDAEAANLRATIEIGRKTQKGTRAAYVIVTAELEGERNQTIALRQELDAIAGRPSQQEGGTCRWDDSLPWPS